MTEFYAKAKLMTAYGEFDMYVFKDGAHEHIALVEQWTEDENNPVLVRIHSKCITSEVFGSLLCDCSEQLEMAKQMIKKEGGLLVYLDQEGRCIGLGNKIRAYAMQQQYGYDTVDANTMLDLPVDARDYSAAIAIIRYFDIPELRLLTNNPRKMNALEQSGIKVRRVPLIAQPNGHNRFYLETKEERMGHSLGLKKEDWLGKIRGPKGEKQGRKIRKTTAIRG